MRLHELTHAQIILRPREDVFAFFADASNLETLTPPWLSFRILTTRPIHMHEGTRIAYSLRLHGVPIRWTSEITAWEPPHRFIDKQLRGPYRLWEHEHRFEEVPGGTRVIDNVRYAVPGGDLVHRLLVAPDLNRVFSFRRARLDEIFRTTEASRSG
jgi:ligand-binding SRPBCC domain-containing protein